MVEYNDTIRKHDASDILKILDRKVKKEERKNRISLGLRWTLDSAFGVLRIRAVLLGR